MESDKIIAPRTDKIIAPRTDDPDNRAAMFAELERQASAGWKWFAGFCCFFFAIVLAVGLLIEVPYIALIPGTARDTEPLLSVEGTESFPSGGEILYTTVSVRQEINLWEYLRARSDDESEIVPAQAVLGDRTVEENREFNLELMNSSKQVAVAVALEKLGFNSVQTDAVVVRQLVADTPASNTLVLGDSILAIDGMATPDSSTLVAILSSKEPGDEIELTVQSFTAEGAEQATEAVSVVLDENPSTVDHALLDAVVMGAEGSSVQCDVDNDGQLDDGQSIPVLLPGQTILCSSDAIDGSGIRVDGSGMVPSGSVCDCDIDDVTTWPADPSSYEAATFDESELLEDGSSPTPAIVVRPDGQTEGQYLVRNNGRASFLGIMPADRLLFESDFGFEVDFDTGNVGGPSAGLAFSLAVLDQLTEGELTGGAKVAVTGTIDASGNVGAVGGVPQKAAAVRDLKADIFIVPVELGEAELDRVRAIAGDNLEIVPVATLDEALAVLEDLGGDIDSIDRYAEEIRAQADKP